MMLEVNGDRFTNFVSGECDIRLDALSNSFKFELSTKGSQDIPFLAGQPCSVYVDGEKVLTGSIEQWTQDHDETSHTITISGRDNTAKLVDSTIGVIDQVFGDDLTLKSLIELIIDHLGLNLKVIDEAMPEPFNPAQEVVNPEQGENAFQFIEKHARKRQVLLTSNADGNIVITKNTGNFAAGVVQHSIGANDNNVISASFNYDNTKRYNRYIVASQGIPVALNLAGDSSLASLVNQGGVVVDGDIVEGRQLYLIVQSTASDDESLMHAQWIADVRRARGLIYKATTDRFRVGVKSDDIWRINMIYNIVDDFVGKIEPMLCNSIKFRMNESTGRTSLVEFVGQRAYTSFQPQDQFSQVSSRV